MNLFQWIKQEATVDDLANVCYAQFVTKDEQGNDKYYYIGLAGTPLRSLEDVFLTNKYLLLQEQELWCTIPKWRNVEKMTGEIKDFKEDIEKE